MGGELPVSLSLSLCSEGMMGGGVCIWRWRRAGRNVREEHDMQQSRAARTKFNRERFKFSLQLHCL